MKRILIYTVVCAGLLSLTTSCGKDYLDVDPKGKTLETNFYQTKDQVMEGLVAAYASLSHEGGWSVKMIGFNSAGDECYTGGASVGDYSNYQAWNTNTMTAVNGPSESFWNPDYQGIYRANLLIQKIGNGVTGIDDALTNRYIAEAKTLRAYFYFELIRLFKTIPLITKPLQPSEWFTATQATREEVYAQIEKDLTEAVAVLPTKSAMASSEMGRMSKECAEALLGKAILFQNNESRMEEAAGWFNKVNTAPGYALCTNFKDIFDPANKFNSESIFEITHTASMQQGDWGAKIFGNMYVIAVGPRSYSHGTEDADHSYVSGWSFSPIIKNFADFMKGDPRFQYTIADVDSLVTHCGAKYTAGYQNTGYFIQKWAPLEKWRVTTGTTELNFPNDMIEIRLADTYLMEAEALVRAGKNTGRAKDLLDAVRARVGLGSVPATLDNIYKERRLELATEGHRWDDLIRTGQAATVLAFKGFKKDKNEYLPIPQSSLNNTKLVQDPAYQ